MHILELILLIVNYLFFSNLKFLKILNIKYSFELKIINLEKKNKTFIKFPFICYQFFSLFFAFCRGYKYYTIVFIFFAAFIAEIRGFLFPYPSFKVSIIVFVGLSFFGYFFLEIFFLGKFIVLTGFFAFRTFVLAILILYLNRLELLIK